MSEKIQIMLNSKTANQYLNNITTDCIFTLPQIDVKRRHKASISVLNAVIPHGFYNVNATNNIFSYVFTTGTETFEIPKGNYNISTLIQVILSLIDNTFNITYDSRTNKVTIVNSSKTFYFSSLNTCDELIGLDTNVSQSPVLSWTSNIGINLFTIRTLNISSDNFILNNINTAQPNKASIITIIPITTNAGGIINYSNTQGITSLVHEIDNINNLHVKLLDQDGDPLDLNGLHWSINLLLIID